MKIMYFMDRYMGLGGAAQTILRQAELMKEAGHTVIVALDDSNGSVCEAYYKFCFKRNIDTVAIPLDASNQPEDIDIIYILENFECLKKVVMDIKPDILHSVQLNPAVELVSRELHLPHVMNIYQAIPDFFKIQYIDIFPKYHICDSEYYANIWRGHFHTNSICIRTVADRNAGSEARRNLNGESLIRCLCVGSVCEWKNQLSVIKACHRVLESGINIRLDVYGNYEADGYGEKCLNYIREHKLDGKIELKGFCDNMAECYQGSDVLICGSTRESYPNAISEALANGVIVVSVPVAGVPEVIKDRQNGYLCNGYTPEDIYEKIVELKQDIVKGETAGIRRNAEITYETTHSPEKVTAVLEQYYGWLMENFEQQETFSIQQLQMIFKEINQIYDKNKLMFSEPMKVRRKLWYLYYIKDSICKNIAERKKFYIWGTGRYGKSVFELLTVYFPSINIAGFVDSYKTGQYMNQSICPPGAVLRDDTSIVIVAAANGQSQIVEQLETVHKKYCEDYYIFSARYW